MKSIFAKNKEPLKFLCSILLSTLLLLPSFGNMVVYFSFKVNQKEIAKTICIQKDLVVNTCNGRCVLEKKLTQLENHQKKTETNLKEKFNLVYTTISINQTVGNPTIIGIAKETFDSTLSQKYETETLGIFHPPLV